MSETQVTPWDEINVDETVSETDQAASEDISQAIPVGKFVCSIIECDAVEKVFKNYSCYAANLKMKIEDVLSVEQPLKDEKGNIIKRNGEVVMKVIDVGPEQKEKINALYNGRLIFDSIFLYDKREKDSVRNRRHFVAKKIGIMSPTSSSLSTSAWPNTVGRKVTVSTERRTWKDDDNITKNTVKVAWGGYEAYSDQGPGENVASDDTSFDPDSFDI